MNRGWLCNSSHLLFRNKIAAAADTDPSRVTVHCVHQHTAPYTDGDAQRLLDQAYSDRTDEPPQYVDFEFLDEVTEVLFARRQRLAVLLDAIENNTIGPSQLDPARIQFLLSHGDARVRQTANRLLGGVELARREQAVAAYRDVLKMKADIVRGRVVFEKECAKCHRLEGVGYGLGLPLATVHTRGARVFSSQILDPNHEVNPAYLNYTLIIDDGLSIMPEGLEKQIGKQDMADLIEYLMSIGKH